MNKARILALSVVALLSACERATSAGSQPDVAAGPDRRLPSWRETAISMLNHGRCADVRRVLQAVPADQLTEDWYGLKAMGEAACWARSHAPADQEGAFTAVGEGLKRYPDSAALMSEKGALFETFGNLAEAMPLYDAARRKAVENLKKNPTSRTDWNVLNRMAKRLGLPPPAPLVRDVGTNESPNDLREGRPAWHVEASRLVATGTWRDTTRYLDEHAHRDSAIWCDLYSQADVACWRNGGGDTCQGGNWTPAALLSTDVPPAAGAMGSRARARAHGGTLT